MYNEINMASGSDDDSGISSCDHSGSIQSHDSQRATKKVLDKNIL
jgi:hypothetical protein